MVTIKCLIPEFTQHPACTKISNLYYFANIPSRDLSLYCLGYPKMYLIKLYVKFKTFEMDFMSKVIIKPGIHLFLYIFPDKIVQFGRDGK